ncbi:DUF2332 domain-containing protein [Actinoallomurus acanthiterrae]
MSDLDRVRRLFGEAWVFESSPLYRALGETVASNDTLLRLAAKARTGQVPTFAFFGAVHHMLLSGTDHELAEFYPSIVGERARPADKAGPALVSFCATYEAELTRLISTRLVQTNHVSRALGLRLGLSVIAREVDDPIHLIEVGASAGLNLRVDRYGYQVGGRRFGDQRSPVQLHARRHGPMPIPDLDVQPGLASVTGIDLHPIDVEDPQARRWLEALVWPENHHQRENLAAALALVADDPPAMRAGDAIDVCPVLADELPAVAPRVVFHSAARIHVPAHRVSAFDSAIATLGDRGPLYRLSIEYPPDPDPRPAPARPGIALTLHRPDGTATDLAVVDGHLDWIEPLTI